MLFRSGFVPSPPKPNGLFAEPPVPAPAPNDGEDVEFRKDGVDDEFKNDGAAPRPPEGLESVENIDARNGFAPPSVPVACGRSPTPSPVG